MTRIKDPQRDSQKKYIHVAVGVVLNEASQVCVTKRKAGQHLAGFWEFPGGKVEAGESVIEALGRELKEEIGIGFSKAEPLIEIRHSYPDKDVFLDVHVIGGIEGDAIGREGQQLKWLDLTALTAVEFPEANIPILRAIEEKYAITVTHEGR
ncbi:8-oxo-dGTP diphosphatase [Thalassocella blandensis]|nr:8-oxo-dGTP diphosphatase [Thalassocella blandensis]